MAELLIAATTAAVNTPKPYKVDNERRGSTLLATGLSGSEKIPVQFSTDKGENWHDLWIDGTKVELSATNTAVSIYSSMVIGVSKPVTSAPVSVSVSSVDDV